jgi:hypothetical protein
MVAGGCVGAGVVTWELAGVEVDELEDDARVVDVDEVVLVVDASVVVVDATASVPGGDVAALDTGAVPPEVVGAGVVDDGAGPATWLPVDPVRPATPSPNTRPTMPTAPAPTPSSARERVVVGQRSPPAGSSGFSLKRSVVVAVTLRSVSCSVHGQL